MPAILNPPKGRPRSAGRPKSSATTVPVLSDDANYHRASGLIKMVADPTRLKILACLVGGEVSVGDISRRVGQSQPATSHHLALLRVGGIITPRRDGKLNFYSLSPTGVMLIEAATGLLTLRGVL